MAIYSLNVSSLSMAKGSSAVKASAYISGERRDRELTGLSVREYARAERVLSHGVELPDGAPEQLRDAGTLWNAAEAFEASRGGSRPARRIRIALPRELTDAQRLALVKKIARHLAAQGMCVEWAVHDERGGNGNYHAHLLVTTRQLSGRFDATEPGRGAFEEAKTVKEYLCGNALGERRMMGAAELKEAKKDGWEKVYNFADGERRTLSEAAKLETDRARAEGREIDAKEARRLARAARASKYAVEVKREATGWDGKDWLKSLRREWADEANAALKAAGRAERIDHRSNRDRGLDHVPTVHLGWKAAEMERRAEADAREAGREYEPVTRAGRVNAEAREANRLIDALKAEAARVGRALEAARAAGAVDDDYHIG